METIHIIHFLVLIGILICIGFFLKILYKYDNEQKQELIHLNKIKNRNVEILEKKQDLINSTKKLCDQYDILLEKQNILLETQNKLIKNLKS